MQLITSAWMRSHPDYYADFLPDSDVDTYCRTTIEPAIKEIDNVGLQVLATALINEAGIAIEVLYLDRSPGAEVNHHEWNVLDAEGKVVESASTIRLLYRPYVTCNSPPNQQELTNTVVTMICYTSPKTSSKCPLPPWPIPKSGSSLVSPHSQRLIPPRSPTIRMMLDSSPITYPAIRWV